MIVARILSEGLPDVIMKPCVKTVSRDEPYYTAPGLTVLLVLTSPSRVKWIQCRAATCLVHLRDCERQPEEVRMSARLQHAESNAMRRARRQEKKAPLQGREVAPPTVSTESISHVWQNPSSDLVPSDGAPSNSYAIPMVEAAYATTSHWDNPWVAAPLDGVVYSSHARSWPAEPVGHSGSLAVQAGQEFEYSHRVAHPPIRPHDLVRLFRHVIKPESDKLPRSPNSTLVFVLAACVLCLRKHLLHQVMLILQCTPTLAAHISLKRRSI